jgi:hypothetical protein
LSLAFFECRFAAVFPLLLRLYGMITAGTPYEAFRSCITGSESGVLEPMSEISESEVWFNRPDR